MTKLYGSTMRPKQWMSKGVCVNLRIGLVEAIGAIVEPTELAYIAGIFDGEGGIQLARNTSGRGTCQEAKLSLKVTITNAHLDMLLRVQELFGGSINSRKWLSKRSAWSEVYDWVLCGKKAAVFLNAIREFTKIKLPQVEAVLVFAETLHTQWKRDHGNGNSLQLTEKGIYLRRIAFRVFRREIEKLCGRGLSWAV